jgi:hypothetical protein
MLNQEINFEIKLDLLKDIKFAHSHQDIRHSKKEPKTDILIEAMALNYPSRSGVES